MDIFVFFVLIIVSVLFGIILTLVAQYYILAKFVQRKPVIQSTNKPYFEKYCLPEDLKQQIEILKDSGSDQIEDNPSLAVSLLLQFLFYELRNRNTVKQWFYEKLSLEFDDLLTKTTTGKFFEAVKIVDLSLGSQFPNIKDIKIDSVKMDNTDGHVETLSISLEIDYSGNFQLSVDAKMKFGKTAFLSIKVKKIRGQARLQFTRRPYTHWSLCFYTDPYIDLGVDSHFQSRQLHSNITSLIISQIKKAIKRKHTLPNYKIRYKPFFKRVDPSQINNDEYEITTICGQLEITVVELSRLYTDDSITSVFCTLTVDTLPWVKICQKNDKTDITSLIIDLVVYKERNQNLGVVFKHGPQQKTGSQLKTLKSTLAASEVTAETIVLNSPAHKAGLKCGDLILAIEGKEINNVAQVAKLFKSVHKNVFNVRIQRNVNNYKLITKQDISHDVTDSINSENDPDSSKELLDINTYTVVNSEDIDTNVTPQILSRSLGDNLNRKNITDSKISKILSSSNENMTKIAHTIGNFSLRKRKTSAEDKNNSSDSSNKSTPNISASNSPDRTKLRTVEPIKTTKTIEITTPPIADIDETKESKAQVTTDAANTNNLRINTQQTDTMILCHMTNIVNISSIVSFNEDFTFDLKRDMKYLNINVWGKSNNIENSPNILLGYVNVPLVNILNECNNSALGRYVNCYSFLPPNFNANQYSYLKSHSGFDSSYCYGDILLSFSWKPPEYTPVDEPNSEPLIPSQIVQENNFKKKHDFIRTQFHQSTQCDFCNKKIWLKDAVQCRNCAICCHKKCIEKCQTGTTCPLRKGDTSDSVTSHLIDQTQKNPYIVMSEPTDVDDIIEELTDASPTGLEYRQYSSLSASDLTNSMKRVNSAHSLTIPESPTDSNQTSRSVPHSTQHTPNRKMSLVTNNPFVDCADLFEKIVENFDENEETLSIILSHIQHCRHNENIMDIAKEASKTLCKSIPQQDRVNKISAMIANLKIILDTQTNKHYELLRKLNEETNETEKTRLAFMIGEADSHIQSLSILMLYFCSGLQDCANDTTPTASVQTSATNFNITPTSATITAATTTAINSQQE